MKIEIDDKLLNDVVMKLTNDAFDEPLTETEMTEVISQVLRVWLHTGFNTD